MLHAPALSRDDTCAKLVSVEPDCSAR